MFIGHVSCRCIVFAIIFTCSIVTYVIYKQVKQQLVIESSNVIRYESNNASVESEPHHSRLNIVFYNRIGKCGSRSMLNIVRKLSNDLNFSYVGSLDFSHDHPPEEERMKEMSRISLLQQPAFYNRHVYFLDFKKAGFSEPTYINIIRDPIERFSSQYNFLKYGDRESQVRNPVLHQPGINDCVKNEVYLCRTNFMFYIGMYFCGFDPICENPSEARVNLAKKHIDENYAFIGMTEEFDTTLMLLQKIFPDYFRGAINYYKDSDAGKKTLTYRKEVLTQESIEKLRKDLMKDEYEVYNYAKQKFIRLKERYGL